MQQALILALFVAIGSGIAIGVQSTLTNWGGRLIGAVSTGLLINFLGGTLAGLVFLIFSSRLNGLNWQSFKSVAPMLVAAGALGVGIITSVAFSFPRTGIVAGMLAVILGQMLVAVMVDTNGWGGLDPIPLSSKRILGLALLAVATWLVLPRSA